jgi:cytochrome c oxidase subunit 4
MDKDKILARSRHIVPYRVYLAVWAALLLLLAATVAVAETRFTSFGVVLNLLIATTQAGLSLMYFMHLRYEGRFLKVMLGVAVAALTVIIIMTFSDVWFRGR